MWEQYFFHQCNLSFANQALNELIQLGLKRARRRQSTIRKQEMFCFLLPVSRNQNSGHSRRCVRVQFFFSFLCLRWNFNKMSFLLHKPFICFRTFTTTTNISLLLQDWKQSEKQFENKNKVFAVTHNRNICWTKSVHMQWMQWQRQKRQESHSQIEFCRPFAARLKDGPWKIRQGSPNRHSLGSLRVACTKRGPNRSQRNSQFQIS